MVKAAVKSAAKSGGNAMVKWDEALAARAQVAKKAEEAVSTGSFISLKSGIMSYGGNPIPGNSLDAVVVDSILENAYFPGEYDPSTPQSPICYAFGRDEESMAPHEKAPNKQSESCSTCKHNEWKSGKGGKGKSCKNVRRLGLITADGLDKGAEGVADATVAYMKVPVTSVKGWAGYVNKLAASNKPPLAFVTSISCAPDPKSQFKVSFNAESAIEDGDLIGALLDKATEVEGLIDFPYQAVEAPPASAGRGKSAAAKAPARKKY